MGMAYAGSTATSPNPPVRIGGSMSGKQPNTTSTGGTGCQLWMYNSSNSTTHPLASNFFSDAKYIGMNEDDVVICQGSTGSFVSSRFG